MVIGSPVRPVEVSKKIKGKERKGKERGGKERKAKHKKSQKWYISRSRRDVTPEAISMLFEPHGLMVIIINFAKSDRSYFNGLG